MPNSMTGFARQEEQHAWGQLICEIRSVNHRYLEPTLRLSDALRNVEPQVRDALRQNLGRGKVEVVLALRTESTQGESELVLNQALAEQLVRLTGNIGGLCSAASPLNPLEVLKWPGVLQTAKLDQEAIEAAATALLDTTLSVFLANRRREGQELTQLIEQRLQAIASQVVLVRERMPELLQLQHDKLYKKLEALQVDVDQDRFAQEVVYLTQKSDVDEELDRLEAHLLEVRRTLKQQGPVGRRLDFLMQELNREANTLSSKSLASDVTQAAVEIKVLIEQMREQIQNIE